MGALVSLGQGRDESIDARLAGLGNVDRTVLAGLTLVTWVLVRVRRKTIVPERYVALELVALYWHFVDVVWVFLWPMFYLMR